MANCNCCIPISCAHCTGYLGFLLTALGIVLVILEPAIVNFGLEQQLTITEGTLFQEQFIEPTLPITISVYMWNVTNADLFTFEETRDGQGRWNFPPPYVEQVGPFLYDEHWLKDQFIYYDDNENVVENPSEGDQKRLKKVQARQTWKYRSLYDPNDPSTGLNPDEYRGNFASILANALPNIVEYAIRDQGKILKAELRDIVNKILAESKALPILKNISVTEALFHYEDPILKYIDLYCRTHFFCRQIDFIKNLPTTFGILVQKSSPLGWPYMEWDTGTDDVQNYGQILGFKTSENDEYMSDLEFWPEDSYCSQIRGTDGTSAPTHLKKGEKIWIFSPDLFRSFYLDYVDEARSPAYNIQTYRYEASSYLYERPNVNPDNACFCYGNYWWDTKDNGLDCLNLAGGYVADVANFGIPLLLSSPHFLDGEPLREIAYGDFNPNREEHCTYLEFESISGTAIKAAKRIQESLVQVRDPHYPMLANIPLDEKTIIMPLLWLNESVTITEDLEQEIYISAVVGLQVLMAAYIILIAGGVILMATSWFVVNKRNASCSDFIRCKTPEK